MSKKAVFAIVAVIVAFTIVGLEWRSFHNTDEADKESLKKQTAANGMPDPQQMQARMLEEIGKEVGLSAAQKDQIQPIQAGMFTQMDTIFKDNTLSQQEKMDKMQRMGETNDAQIKAVMTAEQQTKYDAMQKRMRDRMAGMGGGPGNGMGGPMGGRPGGTMGGGPGGAMGGGPGGPTDGGPGGAPDANR